MACSLRSFVQLAIIGIEKNISELMIRQGGRH